MGPTVGYQSGEPPAPPPAYVSKGQAHAQKGVSCISSLLNPGGGLVKRNGFCLDCKQGEEEERASPEASTETSSIGGGSVSSSIASEEEEGEEEVESKFKAGLGSMGLLEESLPIKRGLSNFFGGKSKSFANLSDVTTVKDLAKPENPLNKRRRILMACKTGRFSTAFYSPLNTSMPNLALEEDSEEEEEEENDKDPSPAPLPIQGRKFKCFKSSRSFSFTDLRDD